MPLNEHDKDLIEAMFRDDCDVNTVLKVVPHAARRTVFRMQQNMELFGQVRKPSSAVKRLLKQWLRRWRDLAPRADDMDSEAYTAQWILHLERAAHWALDGISIRSLFERSHIPSNLTVRAVVGGGGGA
jgi:hypothetical protein